MDREVWLFGADKKIPELGSKSKERIQKFTESWNSHGSPNHPLIELVEDRFLKITSNNASGSVSGCSKDELFKLVQELGLDLGLDFLSRGLTFLKGSDQVISTVGFNQLRGLDMTNSELFIYDLTVKTESEFSTKWCLKVFDSWVAKIPR